MMQSTSPNSNHQTKQPETFLDLPPVYKFAFLFISAAALIAYAVVIGIQVQKSYGSPELASRIVPQSSLPFPGVAVCNVPPESPDLQPSQGNCFVTQDAFNSNGCGSSGQPSCNSCGQQSSPGAPSSTFHYRCQYFNMGSMRTASGATPMVSRAVGNTFRIQPGMTTNPPTSAAQASVVYFADPDQEPPTTDAAIAALKSSAITVDTKSVYNVVHLRRVVTTNMDGTKTVTYQTSFSKAQLNTNSYAGQVVIEMDFPAMEQDERVYNVVFSFTYWLGAMGGAFSLVSVFDKVLVFLFVRFLSKREEAPVASDPVPRQLEMNVSK